LCNLIKTYVGPIVSTQIENALHGGSVSNLHGVGSMRMPNERYLWGMPTSPNSNQINLRRDSSELETIGTRLSNISLDVIRQQIHDSNYEMVNMLSSLMVIVLNPLIQTLIESFQKVADPLSQIWDAISLLQMVEIPQGNILISINKDKLILGFIRI